MPNEEKFATLTINVTPSEDAITLTARVAPIHHSKSDGNQSVIPRAEAHEIELTSGAATKMHLQITEAIEWSKPVPT